MLMLLATYYAPNYAGIIGAGLVLCIHRHAYAHNIDLGHAVIFVIIKALPLMLGLLYFLSFIFVWGRCYR